MSKISIVLTVVLVLLNFSSVSSKDLDEEIYTNRQRLVYYKYTENCKNVTKEQFDSIVDKYTTDQHHKDVLWAIAEIETRHGLYLGKTPIYNHFLNLHSTSNGSTHKYAWANLKAIRKIAQRSNRSVRDYYGSYAGAVGFMQIMPHTFYMYGQDGDGDGIKDMLNPYDSIATGTYYYMSHFSKKRMTVLGKKERSLTKKELKTVISLTLLRYNNSSAYVRDVMKTSRILN